MMKHNDTPCDDSPATSGSFARFVLLLWHTVLVADRCYEEVDGTPATARETFEHLVERLAKIRIEFEGLSIVEKNAMRHNVAALDDREQVLRRLLDAPHAEPRVPLVAGS